MDEQAVREHAQAHADALLAGDIGKAAEEMSKELQHNLGPIVSMLPMPMTEASIESIESTPTGYKVVLHLVARGAGSASRRAGRTATGARPSSRRAGCTRNRPKWTWNPNRRTEIGLDTTNSG